MSRRAAAGVVAALAVVVAMVVVRPAFAAPQLDLSPRNGPPGSTFTVTGTGFAPGEVEIRWASQSGPLLATATGPDFSVEATVPDAPPNSDPVVAVVREGSAVSTFTASFQVTTSSEPVETTAPTTTTVEAPVDTAPVDTAPPTTATTAPAPAAPAIGGTGLSRSSSLSGLGGGVDGGMADTTNGGGGGEAGSDRAVAAPTTPSATGGRDVAGATTIPTGVAPGTVGSPPGTPSSVPAGAAEVRAPTVGGRDQPAVTRRSPDDASDAALAGRSTNQSSGAIRNPALLAVGLGMVFAAGVVLAVKNRHRARPPG